LHRPPPTPLPYTTLFRSHPEIRDLPGRMNHRMPPEGTIEEKFALRHRVRFTEGGVFARLFGTAEVMTNSLHGQGIKQPGKRVVRSEEHTSELQSRENLVC